MAFKTIAIQPAKHNATAPLHKYQQQNNYGRRYTVNNTHNYYVLFCFVSFFSGQMFVGRMKCCKLEERMGAKTKKEICINEMFISWMMIPWWLIHHYMCAGTFLNCYHSQTVIEYDRHVQYLAFAQHNSVRGFNNFG